MGRPHTGQPHGHARSRARPGLPGEPALKALALTHIGEEKACFLLLMDHKRPQGTSMSHMQKTQVDPCDRFSGSSP